MKRVLFLLLITASAISVSAQKDYRDRDRNDRERYHYKYEKRKNVRERQSQLAWQREEYRRQVASINYDFDKRIHAIQRKPFMSRRQKDRKIHDLEMHRRLALSKVREQYASRQRDHARDRRYYDRNR